MPTTMAHEYDPMFSTPYAAVLEARDRDQRDGLAMQLPRGYESIAQVDEKCFELFQTGRLVIANTAKIRWMMEEIKRDIPRAAFQDLSTYMMRGVVDLLPNEIKRDGEAYKLAVSIRGGDTFGHIVREAVPGIQRGFDTQSRHATSLVASNEVSKMGRFDGLECLSVDFMLATGGSLHDLNTHAVDLGATSVRCLAGFVAPQGVINVFNRAEEDGFKIETIYSLPMEAGLVYITDEHKAYIAGGHQPPEGQLHSMLGDFADRENGPLV